MFWLMILVREICTATTPSVLLMLSSVGVNICAVPLSNSPNVMACTRSKVGLKLRSKPNCVSVRSWVWLNPTVSVIRLPTFTSGWVGATHNSGLGWGVGVGVGVDVGVGEGVGVWVGSFGT